MPVWVLCPVVGDGSEGNPYRPSIADSLDVGWSAVYKPEHGVPEKALVRVVAEDWQELVEAAPKGKRAALTRRTVEELPTGRLVELAMEDPHFAGRWVDQPGPRVAGGAPPELDPVETRFFRTEWHNVNGLSARALLTAQGTSSDIAVVSVVGSHTAFYRFDVIRRTAGGSETVLGSVIAQTSRTADGSGMQQADWSCPATALVPTDAIRVNIRVLVSTLETNVATITPQLGATLLNAAVWTIHRHSERTYEVLSEDPIIWGTVGRVRWGEATYNSRIENFTWSVGQPPTAWGAVFG